LNWVKSLMFMILYLALSSPNDAPNTLEIQVVTI
jgi:hypothetical protein